MLQEAKRCTENLNVKVQPLLLAGDESQDDNSDSFTESMSERPGMSIIPMASRG
jgi:hypothetical protein